MVNRYIDAKARKTPLSISLPNELVERLHEYVLKKYGGRLSVSEFFEDFVRQTLEDEGKISIEDPGLPTSVNTIRAYIHRIKEFVSINSKEHKIGNLDVIRWSLAEASFFCDQEISRTRIPTKSDKKRMELEQSIAAHREKVSDTIVNTPNQPIEQEQKQLKQELGEADPVEVDLEYEKMIDEEYAGFKEEAVPKPEFDIVDEGRTVKNTFNNDGEEVFS